MEHSYLYLIISKEDKKIVDIFQPIAYECKFLSYFNYYYTEENFCWIKINFLDVFNKTKGDLMFAEVVEVSNE